MSKQWTALMILWLTALASSVSVQAADPPNILLIVSDDQGYSDLGCYGSDEALTPNLDRIAAEGARLTNFYVAWPACTPSRAALLTGRYPQRNGIYDMIRNEAPDYGHRYDAEEYRATFERIGGMDVREVLMPELLKPAGYVSGIFGKWDLGVHRRFLPLQRGFDDFYGFCNTGVDYFTHERYGVPSMFRGNEPTEQDKGTYATDLFLREAKRFLSERGDEPFLLYVPFNAPHGASNLDPKIRGAAQAPPRYHQRFPQLLSEAGYREGTRYGEPAEVPNRARRRLEYLASIAAMDDAIGELLDQLEQMGQADETLVIFFSDNGGSGIAENHPLRGRKGQVFEGGVRVPCLVRWPGRVPAGVTSDAFLTTLEIVPTLLAAAGLEPPESITMDGFDMLPVLRGDESPRREMFWQRRGNLAARVGDWKWVDSQRGGGLFHLTEDPGEQNDLSDERPEKLGELKAAFAAWKAEMAAAEPRRPFRDF